MSQYLEAVVKPGDRWDLLAYRYYGDALRYQPILDANRGLFVGAPLTPIPPVLPAGTILRIPILDNSVKASAPPWRTV